MIFIKMGGGSRTEIQMFVSPHDTIYNSYNDMDYKYMFKNFKNRNLNKFIIKGKTRDELAG